MENKYLANGIIIGGIQEYRNTDIGAPLQHLDRQKRRIMGGGMVAYSGTPVKYKQTRARVRQINDFTVKLYTRTRISERC